MCAFVASIVKQARYWIEQRTDAIHAIVHNAARAGDIAPRALRADPFLRVRGGETDRHDADAERPRVGRHNLGQQNLNVERDAPGRENLSASEVKSGRDAEKNM